MSETEYENRHWRVFIQDMIEFSKKVLSYTDGLTEDDFTADGLTYDATLHNLQLIGKAAAPVPVSIREAHPEIPWSSIIETKNRLTHGYLGIDNIVVWDIIQADVPDLLPKLQRLLDSAEQERP